MKKYWMSVILTSGLAPIITVHFILKFLLGAFGTLTVGHSAYSEHLMFCKIPNRASCSNGTEHLFGKFYVSTYPGELQKSIVNGLI